MNRRRNQRALAVIRALRQRQKKQNQQIELLCRDMVGAHGEFARKLSRTGFMARFYETLMGTRNLQTLLDTAAASIQARIADSHIAIFILESHGFDIHLLHPDAQSPRPGHEEFQSWFTPECAQNIALSGSVCRIDKMLAMGMQASPAVLKTISAAAVPLGLLGQAVGFILLWRGAEAPLTREELESVICLTSGLRASIAARREEAPVEKAVSNSLSRKG